MNSGNLPLGDVGDGLEVRRIQLGVPYGLKIDGPGPLVDPFPEGLDISRAYEPGVPSELGERMMEQLEGASIQVVGGEDLIARPGDGQ